MHTTSKARRWAVYSAGLLLITMGCHVGSAAPGGNVDVAKLITSAKAGSTVKLSAGTFTIADVTIPAGVSVVGAGYDKTILDASKGGLRVQNGKDITVSDLTIEGAGGTALAINNSSGVKVQRVHVANSVTGIGLDGATGSRVENCIVSGNHIGVVCARSRDTAIVNNTVANNDTLSLSVLGDTHCAIFNNVFTGSQTGVTADKNNTDVALDYNGYVALFIGGITGEPARESLPAWRDVSGYDRHSVELKVEYADAAKGNFRPVTSLPWSPNRATTSEWGMKQLATFAAPTTDIGGNARSGEVDLGAYETKLAAARPADGKFTVQGGEGVVSAGVFTPEGRNVAYLFQNLPLRKGSYDFWLPKGVPAGNYEVRVAESNLGLRYIGLIGGTGANIQSEAPSIDPMLVAYDADNNPLLFSNGAEDYSYVRSFDAGLKKNRWRLTGGGGALGATVDDAGNLYFLQAGGLLFKVRADTGAPVAIDGASFRKTLPGIFSDTIAGMTFLDGNLFVGDTGKNKIFVTGANELTFARGFDIEAPRYPAADAAHKLIWVISGQKIVALDAATGARKYEVSPVAQPMGLSIRNNRMAVSDGATHQVHLFDLDDPTNLKPLTNIGREWKASDTGFGVFDNERLYSAGPVAIDNDGNIITIDENRVKVFGADGHALRTPLPFWGQQTPYGMLLGPDGKPELNFIGFQRNVSVVLDLQNGTWRPGYRFSFPKGLPDTLMTLFNEGGHNYAAFSAGNADQDAHYIVRFDGGVGKTVLAFHFDKTKNAFVMQTDSNGDDLINDMDASQPLPTPGGVAVSGIRFMQDGRLISNGTVIPRHADADGNLSYDWSKYVAGKKVGTLQTGGQGNFNGEFLPNGNWVSAGGPSRGFGGGFTQLQAVNANGDPLWVSRLDYHSTTGAFKSVRVLPDVLLTTAVEELDTAFTDYDGLGMGFSGPIKGLNWEGYWHDQDWSLATFTGPNDRRFMVLGDYTRHGYHWMELTGADTIRHSKVAVTVDAPKVALLAAAPDVVPVAMPVPPTPQVLVRKLAAPLPIDGDLKKWRDLGITPQIIVSPPGVSPTNCSALIRTAYEGDSLYFQVIKFDDIVTMHQPLEKHYKQDSTEFALFGGFMGGYKFSVTHTTDQGDILYREQFLMHKELNLDPAKAPRVIKVLDNARDVEERRLIEQAYGVDLSNSKVIITEFKIPLSYAWDGKPPIEMKSGNWFWMGLFIDDSDKPGADEQHAYSWPVTFQAFGNPDQGAKAILE